MPNVKTKTYLVTLEGDEEKYVFVKDVTEVFSDGGELTLNGVNNSVIAIFANHTWSHIVEFVE